MAADPGLIRSNAARCPDCGKIRYLTRPDAKRAGRQYGKRMRAYRCPVSSEFWHLASFGPAGRVAFYREQEAGCGR